METHTYFQGIRKRKIKIIVLPIILNAPEVKYSLFKSIMIIIQTNYLLKLIDRNILGSFVPRSLLKSCKGPRRT